MIKIAIRICPRCQRRYTYTPHTGDYVHQCNSGDTTLDQEDVVIVGNWEDYTGSGIAAEQVISQAGLGNDVQFEDAGIRGADVDEFTDRGHIKSTHRQRKHLEYIPDPAIDKC